MDDAGSIPAGDAIKSTMRRVYSGDIEFPQKYPNGVVDSSGSSRSGSAMSRTAEDLCGRKDNPGFPFSTTTPLTWEVENPGVSWEHLSSQVRSADAIVSDMLKALKPLFDELQRNHNADPMAISDVLDSIKAFGDP